MTVTDHKTNICTDGIRNGAIGLEGDTPTKAWISFLNRHCHTLDYHDVWCALGMHCPEMIESIKAECKRYGGFVPYQQGYVYCIQAVGTNYYKLGKTTNPDRRLLQIAPKMPFATRFVKVWQTNFMDLAEKWLHKSFAEYRTNGEWFELTPSEFYEFFMDSECTFSDQLRHIYCSYFFENLNAPGFLEALDSIGHDTDNHMFTLEGSAESIAWIENLFADATYSEFQFSKEIQEQCAPHISSFLEGVTV